MDAAAQIHAGAYENRASSNSGLMAAYHRVGPRAGRLRSTSRRLNFTGNKVFTI